MTRTNFAPADLEMAPAVQESYQEGGDPQAGRTTPEGSSTDDSSDGYVAYPMRYWVLLVFSMLACEQGLVWFTFAPIVTDTKIFYPHVTDQVLELFNTWSPIFFIPFVFVTSWMLTSPQWGLRSVVLTGAAVGFAGNVLRALTAFFPTSEGAVYVLHLGQICNAILGPFVIAPPSFLSATWFPESERTRATAVGILANNLGFACAFLVGPYTVQLFSLPALLAVEAVFAGLVFMAAYANFPSRPPSPPCAVEADAHAGAHMVGEVSDQMVKLFADPSFIVLCAVYGWQSGAFNAWTSLFDEMLQNVYDEVFVGWLSFVSNVGYIVGGLVMAQLADTAMKRRHKRLLLYSFVFAVPLFLLFTLALPNPFSAVGFLTGGSVVLIAGLVGLCVGAAAPIYFEFAAELTYPISAGSSASMLALAENLGALLLYTLAVPIPAEFLNSVMSVFMLMCCGAMVYVKEKYARTDSCRPLPKIGTHSGSVRRHSTTFSLSSSDLEGDQARAERETTALIPAAFPDPLHHRSRHGPVGWQQC
eukprot:TRINITY_DN17314_c0_g1_i1.p1 TRINITY_DN17314_c0_g1~~TRINITY_DN17314_c0_g1_i1.p1  ORF type:complete len:532 (+),score=76.49 TRINITY_DN17314_c0_g1_i1:1005-2600(+)